MAESARGPALGLLPGREFAETRIAIEPGDLWLAYTDGFTEAISAGGEMFGASRLRERLAAAPGVIRETGDRIVREVLKFLGGRPQSDDMCLVAWGQLANAVERTGELRVITPDTTRAIR
jgi:serine phosphatase RsbU (regulator of sigma subunit)